MKKQIIFFVVALLGCASTVLAQDSTKTKIKEYYLTFAGLSPLNIQLQFKKQIAKRTFFKLSLVNLSYNESYSGSSNPNQFTVNTATYSGGLQVGIEFRKTLNKNFALYHGPNLKAAYYLGISKYLDPSVSNEKQKNTTQTFQSAIPYTLGILFNITPNILISSEINPSVMYNYNWYTDGQNSTKNFGSGNFNIGFDNRFAAISLVYRP